MLTYAAKALGISMAIHLLSGHTSDDVLKNFTIGMKYLTHLQQNIAGAENSTFANIYADADDSDKEMLRDYAAYHPRYQNLIKSLR